DYSVKSSQIYDPVADTWTAAAPTHEPRHGAGTAVLPDGRVLVAGGWGWSSAEPRVPYALRSAELFDPPTRTWTPTGSLNDAPGTGAALTTRPDGRPVMIGGFHYDTVDAAAGTYADPVYSRSVEIYDAASGTWTKAQSTQYGRSFPVAAALPDGSVLV